MEESENAPWYWWLLPPLVLFGGFGAQALLSQWEEDIKREAIATCTPVISVQTPCINVFDANKGQTVRVCFGAKQ